MLSAQRLFLVSAICLVLVAAGCGDDSSSSTAEGEATQESFALAELGSRVKVPEGPPPKELVIKDLSKGTGPAAKVGDEVEFQYVDALYSTGEVTSVAHPSAPYHLELGSHASIPGWEQGLVGMRVGGRRELIIPSHLAYIDEGSSSVPPQPALILQAVMLAIK